MLRVYSRGNKSVISERIYPGNAPLFVFASIVVLALCAWTLHDEQL